MSIPEANNLVPGNTIPIFVLKNMNQHEENRLVDGVNKYVASEAKLKALQAHKEKIRKGVILFLGKALRADEKTIINSISEEKRGKVRVNFEKNCVVIDNLAMTSIILPYVIEEQLENVNLKVFKDEISEVALISFFEALPKTSLTSVGISKPLSEREIEAKSIAETKLAKLGRCITWV